MRTTGTYWTVRRSGLQIHISPQTLESDGIYCYPVRLSEDTNPCGKLGENVFETEEEALLAAYEKLIRYHGTLNSKISDLNEQARKIRDRLMKSCEKERE